jgi:hypothetical protein
MSRLLCPYDPYNKMMHKLEGGVAPWTGEASSLSHLDFNFFFVYLAMSVQHGLLVLDVEYQ